MVNIYLLIQVKYVVRSNFTFFFSFVLMFFAHVPAEYYIAILILLCIGLMWKERKVFLLPIVGFLLGISFLFKFSLFIFGLSSYILFVFMKCLVENFKVKLYVLLEVILILLAIPIMYLIYNPNMKDLINYTQVGLSLSSGFSDAMSLFLSDIKYEVPLALWLTFFLLVYISLIILLLLTRNYNNTAYLVIFSAPLFLIYKHGFVRADMYHLEQMMRAFLAVFSIIILFANWDDIKNSINSSLYGIWKACGVMLVFSAVVATLLFNYLEGENIPTPNHYSVFSYANNMNKQPRNDFVNIGSEFTNQIIGHSVAFFPSALTVDNCKISYTPLPLIVNYSAYTPQLDEINSNIFKGSKAVEFIVLSYSTIDKRIPIMETPITWITIFENYELVIFDSDKEMVLLRKKNDPTMDYALYNKKEIVQKIPIAICEDIMIPDDINGISINAELNFKGKIAKFLWKIPAVDALLEYNDGTSIEGRVIMNNLSSTFDVNCLPQNISELAKLLDGENKDKRVKKISFYGDGCSFYSDTMEVCYCR